MAAANGAMTTGDINYLLSCFGKTADTYVGCYAADDLISLSFNTWPWALVTNISPARESGLHWVAFYSSAAGHLEFFDSYGQSAAEVYGFTDFVEKHGYKRYACSTSILQSSSSAVCGQFCIYFIVLRCDGNNLADILATFYQKQPGLNDNLVVRFVHHIRKLCCSTAALSQNKQQQSCCVLTNVFSRL